MCYLSQRVMDVDTSPTSALCRMDKLFTQEEEKRELSNGVVITMRPASLPGETMLWVDNYAGTKIHVLDDFDAPSDYQIRVIKHKDRLSNLSSIDPLVKYMKVNSKDVVPIPNDRTLYNYGFPPTQYMSRNGRLLYKTLDDPCPTIQFRVPNADTEKWIAACARA